METRNRSDGLAVGYKAVETAVPAAANTEDISARASGRKRSTTRASNCVPLACNKLPCNVRRPFRRARAVDSCSGPPSRPPNLRRRDLSQASLIKVGAHNATGDRPRAADSPVSYWY